jgi:hypothetical protein
LIVEDRRHGDSRIHRLFIDNSNVFGGAQRASGTAEPHGHWRTIRVYYRHLFQIVEDGRNAFTRVMAGSVPPGNDALWDHARAWGYSTDLLKRVEQDDGKMAEQGVDEVLHLKIANTLLDFDGGTLVIVSGDGQPSHFDTSFPQQVERALKRGWSVEIWSWQGQLTKRYEHISGPGKALKVRTLDPHYHRITFLKGGTYEGVLVSDRIVSGNP